MSDTEKQIERHFFELANKYGNAVAKQFLAVPAEAETEDETRLRLVGIVAAAHLTGATQATHFLIANDGTRHGSAQNLNARIMQVGTDLGLQLAEVTERKEPS